MDPVSETINTYNQIAPEYKARYEKYGDQNQMQPMLDKFISLLQGKKVLDVGTGAGFDAKYLSDRGFEVVGIDLSEKMIDVAKSIAPNVSYKVMDIRTMDFPNGSFDGIWASASLVHIQRQDMNQIIQNISRMLKSHGIAFISLKEGIGEGFVTNKGEDNLDGAKRFFCYYTTDEIVLMISKAKMKLIESSRNEKRNNTWLAFFCTKD